MSESVLRITIDSRNAEQNARNLSRELNSIEKSGDFASKSMDSMSVATRGLAGYMAGILTISGAIAKADGYTQMAARIRNATKDAVEYDLVQNRVLATANTTFRSLNEAQEVYLSLSGGMKSLKKSTGETLDLVDSLSFSFTHNATRTDQAQSAMDSLSKSMAKGKIDADAWISIVTGADNVIADMAKTTGKSEAEIRKLGASGKASLEDLIKTLISTRDQNEKLANNMENSLKDGFTKLSNEVTVYLGKANEATNATGIMAGGLGVLADNLETVANIAMVGGAYWAGTYIPAIMASTSAGYGKIKQLTEQTTVQLAAISAERVAAASSLAQAEAQVVNTQATLAALASEKTLEIQRLKSQITDAGRIASTTRMAQLRKIETQVTAELTVAENALASAKARSTAATSASIGVGRAALGVLGGPVGLGLTVATVAAGYLIMKGSADKATTSIDIQGQSVSNLIVKYRELNGLQRDNETKALADQVENLGLKYRVASSDLHAFMEGLPIADEKIATFRKLNKELSWGRISTDEYYQAVKGVNILTDSQLVKVRGLIGGYSDSKKAFNEAEIAQKALARSAISTTSEVKNQAKGVENLSDKLSDFNKKLKDREFNAEFSKNLLNANFTEGQINVALEVANEAREKGVTATKEMYKKALRIHSLEKSVQDSLDAKNKTQKEITSELGKQQKILQLSSSVQANAAKYNFNNLESKYALPSGTLSSIHAIETGNTGKTNQVNQQTGATGGFQFLSGTAQQYGVKDRTDMAQSAEGAAKYMSYLLKLFKGDLEKAVRAYHAGEGNVQKGKNIGKYNNDYWKKYQGYMAGSNGFAAGDMSSKEWEKQLEDVAKMAEQQAELRKSLELEVANEVTRIRTNLATKIEEIEKANFTPEKSNQLKAEYQSRADSEIAITEYALKTKLDDYSDFQKSESDLLKKSFDEKKFYTTKDIELSQEQKDKAIQFLDEQYRHEVALLALAKEERLFQMQQSLLSANAQSEKYWNLERQRIMLSVNDLEERNKQIAIANALQGEEKRISLNSATQKWGQTQAEMSGRGDKYQLEQQRFSRIDQSQDLFDAQLALAETAAEREAIWQAHHERMKAIESDYQTSSYSLQLGYAQNVAGALSGMFGAMLGESSSAYHALYSAQQAFALAQAGMNVWKSASDAYANEPGTVWQKMGAATTATIESGTFVSMIQAATPKGFETGGYTGSGGLKDVAGVVHGQEFVLNAQATKRVGVANLDAINSGKALGGGDVIAPITVEVNIQSNGESSVDSQGQSKQLGLMIGNAVRSVILQEKRQGGLLSK